MLSPFTFSFLSISANSVKAGLHSQAEPSIWKGVIFVTKICKWLELTSQNLSTLKYLKERRCLLFLVRWILKLFVNSLPTTWKQRLIPGRKKLPERNKEDDYVTFSILYESGPDQPFLVILLLVNNVLIIYWCSSKENRKAERKVADMVGHTVVLILQHFQHHYFFLILPA